MQGDDKLKKVLSRVEPVEWLYDGLGGKVIRWTFQHGNDHKDPSVLAFFVGRDGKSVERCPGGKAYSASGLSKWLAEKVDRYERTHPRTLVPFLPAEIEQGACGKLEAARRDGKPVLLYAGREPRPDDKKKAKAEVKACRKFEQGALGSKKAAAAAKGWVLLRLDLAEKAHAEFAKSLGVAQAPALLMFLPGEEKPTDLGTKLKGPNLAFHLKKHAPK